MYTIDGMKFHKFESLSNESNSIILCDMIGTTTIEDKEGLRESLLVCDKYVQYKHDKYYTETLNSVTIYKINDRFIDSNNNLVLLVEIGYKN